MQFFLLFLCLILKKPYSDCTAFYANKLRYNPGTNRLHFWVTLIQGQEHQRSRVKIVFANKSVQNFRSVWAISNDDNAFFRLIKERFRQFWWFWHMKWQFTYTRCEAQKFDVVSQRAPQKPNILALVSCYLSLDSFINQSKLTNYLYWSHHRSSNFLLRLILYFLKAF